MSFAQEMKDFMSAWTATSEMGNNKKRIDLQREEIENLKAYREATLEMDRQRLEMSKQNSDRNYALAAKRNSEAAAASEAKQMNEVYENLGGLEESGFDWDPEGEAIPTEEPAFRRGGLVAKAAEGGLLEEDPDMPFVDPQNPYVDPAMNVQSRTAIPPEPIAPNTPRPARAAGLATPATKPAAAAKPEAAPDTKALETVSADAETAVSDAAPALIEDTKKPKAAVGPDAETERMDIAKNEGGLSMAEYQDLIKTIDPNDSIPAYLKSATVLASTHRYFMENGQPEKAQRVAKGILILNKQMTQTLGALAQNAMEDGDVPAAAQLVTDAANQFPTGHQFKVTPTEGGGLTYTVMKNGKEAGGGELTTEQLWELTGKVKDGSLFIEEMGRVAGAKSKNVGPAQALELTSGAYAAATQAKQALDLAIEEGVEGEELNALRQTALNATNTYKKYRSNALQMGLKPSDIKAANTDAEAMAIPDAPTEKSEEPGWLDGVTGFIADSFTTSDTPATPEQAVTPQGNPQGNPQPATPGGMTLDEQQIAAVRATIASGADRATLLKELSTAGYDISGL